MTGQAEHYGPGRELPPGAQEFMDQAHREEAHVIGTALVAVQVGDERRAEVHLSFALPCVHEEDQPCPGVDGLIVELTLEDAVRLRASLGETLDDPEDMKAIAEAVLGPPGDPE